MNGEMDGCNRSLLIDHDLSRLIQRRFDPELPICPASLRVSLCKENTRNVRLTMANQTAAQTAFEISRKAHPVTLTYPNVKDVPEGYQVIPVKEAVQISLSRSSPVTRANRVGEC